MQCINIIGEFMITTMNTLMLGAIGSVIGTFLFIIINSWWRCYALPKIQDKIYRGARVDGEWEYVCQIDGNQKQIYILEITQRADILSGIYTLCSDIDEGLSTSTYSFNGYIADGFILGTSRPNNRDSLYHATFCLKIVEELDSIALAGKLSAMELKNNKIFSWDVHFRRKSKHKADKAD